MTPGPPSGWIRLAWIFTIGGSILGAGADLLVIFAPAGPWIGPLMACAALTWLFVAAWGPQALSWSQQRHLEALRARVTESESAAVESPDAEPDADSKTSIEVEQAREQVGRYENRLKRSSHWWQASLVLLGTSGSLLSWYLGWPKAQVADALIWFGLVGLLSFPSLIMGNALANNPNKTYRRQAGFTRFATISLLVVGLTTLLHSVALPVDIVAGDAPLSIWALRALATVQIVLAAEWIVRAFVSPFLPQRSADHLNDSLVLNLVAGSQTGETLGDRVHEQLGIDISQSWAVQFIRQSTLWLVMVLGVATWLSTGVTTLRVDERGIHQRLGLSAPELLEPGLHFHLPWPLGSVRRLSYGRIEEVRLNASADFEAPESTAIEAPSRKSDDRIWSKSHGEELFLMIANQPRLSSSDGEQLESQRSYELYHADVVITYRIGLNSKSSHLAVYRLADANKLVGQIGRRELIDLFNNRTAEDLIFANFSAFSQASHRAIQQRLNELNTGIDIVDVIFEAVHPPIDTAPTFHRVHGAAKESAASVDIVRAEAEQEQATAQIVAAQIHDQAKADAFSNAALARAERVAFLAERRAYANQQSVFTFERALQAFEQTFSDKNLIIVDPNISADQGLVLDLREQSLNGRPQE
ncbi:MAG: SPFH domain-containing protein [Pseudomonadota bacterium]